MSGVAGQLATATLLGAVVGSVVVYGYARWAARRAPRIRFRRRTVSAEDMRRLVEAFTAVRPAPARFVDERGAPTLHELGGERGPATGGVVGASVPPRGEDGCELRPAVPRLYRGGVELGPSRLVGEDGPELTDLSPATRYTYVRGPVRNRDTDRP